MTLKTHSGLLSNPKHAKAAVGRHGPKSWHKSWRSPDHVAERACGGKSAGQKELIYLGSMLLRAPLNT